MPRKITRPRASLLICLALAFATLAAYWRVRHFEFLTYDDPYYITENTHVQGGLTWANVVWAFTTRTATNWHPLTWLSHMLDWEIYGANAGGHHFTNLLFHICNTLLVFLLLNRLTGTLWRSALVAALFALHPLHVESVAWVSERKDVLSTFFGLLAIWAYARFTEKPLLSRYLLIVLLFALSLMSKPMLVTLPFLLLLLDFWPLKRITSFQFRPLRFSFARTPSENSPALPQRGIESAASNQPTKAKECLPLPRGEGGGEGKVPSSFSTVHADNQNLGSLLLEKCPLLVLSALSCIVTIWAQQEAITSEIRLPLVFRLSNAVLSYCRYIKYTLWPVRLVINYPYPRIFSLSEVVICAIVLVLVTVWAWRHAKEFPFLVTGWLWFLGALVPTIGIVQVGTQSMADRYMYVPSIGLFIIAAWGGYDLATRRQIPSLAMFGGAALAVGACIPLSVAQVYCWRNSIALYEHAIRLRPDDVTAEYDLATTLAKQGDLDSARSHFERTLQLSPNSFMAHESLAELLGEQEKFIEAIPEFEAATRLYSSADPDFHTRFAGALAHVGRISEAIDQYQLALKLDPQEEDAMDGLAWILATNPDDKIRNGAEAVRLAEHARDIAGGTVPKFFVTLAAAYAEAGRFDDAIAVAKKAEQLSTAAGDKNLTEKSKQMTELFATHHPFRDPVAASAP